MGLAILIRKIAFHYQQTVYNKYLRRFFRSFLSIGLIFVNFQICYAHNIISPFIKFMINWKKMQAFLNFYNNNMQYIQQ